MSSGRSPQGDAGDIDLAKLHKSAVRACADRLVSLGGFKFRRSAFKGQQPKVTLLVPQTLGLFRDSFPIDFSFNAMTPFYNAALLAECGQIDARTQQLILLVRRWAKDRGICHSAKGHLSPYVWGLLAIYYLQVSGSDETPLLPPVDEFEIARLGCEKASGFVRGSRQPVMPEKSVGALFKGFLHFFSTFDWRIEAVSAHSGKRAPPSSEIPIHMLSPGQVGPTIEDPFQKANNLGDCMTVASLARLEEELLRARELTIGDASLSKLLEPWAPAEVEEEEVPKKSIGEDWRRDAMEARSTTTTAKTPPWRRANP
jgi:DNA polymerase sigma